MKKPAPSVSQVISSHFERLHSRGTAALTMTIVNTVLLLAVIGLGIACVVVTRQYVNMAASELMSARDNAFAFVENEMTAVMGEVTDQMVKAEGLLTEKTDGMYNNTVEAMGRRLDALTQQIHEMKETIDNIAERFP